MTGRAGPAADVGAALATRLDAALDSGGQVAAALARTPVTRLRRSGPRPSRSPR